METVLVIGATGNIGVSAVKAALRSGRRVLALIRNQASANKLIERVGSSEGITFAEADILSESGVKSVVDRVLDGKLPAFQHVWSSLGAEYAKVSLQEIEISRLRHNMNVGFEANFIAYRDTIGYLLEQNSPVSTWTICTGAQGDQATFPLPAMTQGALFSMCTAACRENENTNVRFNEIYLAFRVEVDKDAARHGVVSSSEFSSVYEQVLGTPHIRSSRVSVKQTQDIKQLRFQKKF